MIGPADDTEKLNSETMINIFSKNKGKKAPTPKAEKTRAKNSVAKGSKALIRKKLGAEAKSQNATNAKTPEPDLENLELVQPRAKQILLHDVPSPPKPKRKKKVNAGASLDAAKEALQKNAPRTNNPAMRKKAIAQAMAVHSTQSKLLDDLDPETRRRLRALAMQKLIVERNK